MYITIKNHYTVIRVCTLLTRRKLMNLLKQIFKKEDIAKFQNKDAHLERTLRIRDF